MELSAFSMTDIFNERLSHLASVKKEVENKRVLLECKKLDRKIALQEKKSARLDEMIARMEFSLHFNKKLFLTSLDGIKVRHFHKRTGDCWTGCFEGRIIKLNGTIPFSSPTNFVNEHLNACKKYYAISPYKEIEVFINGDWISLDKYRLSAC